MGKLGHFQTAVSQLERLRGLVSKNNVAEIDSSMKRVKMLGRKANTKNSKVCVLTPQEEDARNLEDLAAFIDGTSSLPTTTQNGKKSKQAQGNSTDIQPRAASTKPSATSEE